MQFPRTLLLMVALLSLIAGLATIQAQTGTTCCRCGRPYTVSQEGYGLSRDYVGMCGDCKHELGDLKKAIENVDRVPVHPFLEINQLGNVGRHRASP